MEVIMIEIKELLLSFNHPTVHSIDDEEFNNIFKSSNRLSLIYWILNQLDGSYGEVKEDESVIAQQLSTIGCCSEGEASDFVKGKMDLMAQMRLIHRLLDFIKKIKMNNPMSDTPDFTMEDLEALLSTDVNLFPMFGEMKLAEEGQENGSEDDEDLTLKLKEEKKENVREVKREDTVESTEEDDNEDNMSPLERYEELTYLKGIMENMPKIKTSANSLEEPSTYRVGHIPGLDELLHGVNEYMTIIAQYVEDCEIVKYFMKEIEEEEEDCNELGTVVADLTNITETLGNYFKEAVTEDD